MISRLEPDWKRRESLEAEDGDTYRITEKGKAQAALHREGRV